MSEIKEILLNKKVFGFKDTKRSLNRDIVEFLPKTSSVGELFDIYNALFYEISSLGKKSHTSIVKKSSKYAGIPLDPQLLEIEDLELLSKSQFDKQSEQEVFNSSRYLKGIKYPGRYMYLISIFPDIQYHIPALIWYLSFIVLFFNIFRQLKTNKLNNLVSDMETSAKILIFYQIFSLLLGINTYFNSFSNFLFSLSRNAELITFGINQTWRGIASHYEMFSNLQIISLCYFLITYFVTKKNIYIFFSLISFVTTFLSQSIWYTLLFFLLLLHTIAKKILNLRNWL